MKVSCLVMLPFLLVMPALLQGQDFSPEGYQELSQGLSEVEKVQFINKNFYKLYSADFDHAKSLATWAASATRKNGWPKEEAYAQLNLGVAAYLAGDYPEVLTAYFRSRDLFDSLGDKRGLAAINNEMAVFYYKQKEFKNAMTCLNLAENLARETKDSTALGTSLGHRATFLTREGKHTEARRYFEEVYRIRLQTRDSVGLGYVLVDLAEIVLLEGNLAKSLAYIDQSTVIRKAIGDLQGVAINHVNKGENYFKVGQFPLAASSFETGLRLSIAVGFDDLNRHIYQQLGKTYLAMKEYKKAYELQEKFVLYKDSLFNIERSKVIQELQTKYETEKKDLQIVDLNKDNQLKAAKIERNIFLTVGLVVLLLLLIVTFAWWRYRSRQRQLAVLGEQRARMREAQITAVIDSQETERRRFATDLHDGMGQLIAALQLNIQALRQAAGQPVQRDTFFESSEQLLKEVHEEIRNIAFNLMPPVLVKEGLVPAVSELVRKINKTGRMKAEFSVFELENRLPERVEISLYRIIQELLSNIIKYAEATEVTISFTGYPTEVVLTIDDNGMGYDLNTFKVSEGNGWRNINSRLHLIKASIEWDVVKGRKNSTVIITIPLEESFWAKAHVSTIRPETTP